ncbi:MAG: cytochrome C oxidase subunit IV family protein [Planctomycetota bacterium]
MSDHEHADDGYNFAHPMPVPMLLIVFAALTLLTIVTVAQASFDFGSYDVLIVMAIATVKAGLVAFFFMHLAWDKPFNVLLFLGSFVFVGLFVIFTLGDASGVADSLEPTIDEVVTTTAAQ